MNTTVKSVLCLLVTGIVAGVGRPSVAAESLVTATIPFDFIAGDTRLPAGDYTIREASDGPTVLLIEGSNGVSASLVATIAAISTDGNATSPDVQFETFGKEHFLSRIDMHDGMAREIVLTPSIMENELVKVGEHSGN